MRRAGRGDGRRPRSRTSTVRHCLISTHLSPLSVERKMPQWCWHQSTSGSSSHRRSGAGPGCRDRPLVRAAGSWPACRGRRRPTMPHRLPCATPHRTRCRRARGRGARIDADRVDAGVVITATEPLRALAGPRSRRRTATSRHGRRSGTSRRDRAVPQHARRRMAGLDRPAELVAHDLALRHRVDVRHALGFERILGRRDLVPRVAAVVAAVEVHAEVPVVERRVDGAVARIDDCVTDRGAEERRCADRGRTGVDVGAEQALTGSDPCRGAGVMSHLLRVPGRR